MFFENLLKILIDDICHNVVYLKIQDLYIYKYYIGTGWDDYILSLVTAIGSFRQDDYPTIRDNT